MFELVYLHPFTDERLTVTDLSKVKAANTLQVGVYLQLTSETGMFIPAHRIMSITGPNSLFG